MTNARGTLSVPAHRYAAPGSYTATLYVRDKDGAMAASTPLAVTVTP